MAHFNKKSFLILDRKWILSYERHYKSLFYTVFIYLFVNLVIGISFSWRFLEKFISRAPSSDCCGVIVDTLGKFEIMTRVILIPYDLVTPFDLEGQTFRVNVELSTFFKFMNVSLGCPPNSNFGYEYTWTPKPAQTELIRIVFQTVQGIYWFQHLYYFIF